MAVRIFRVWVLVAVLLLAAALVLFTGRKESEVAGNLMFAMLVLGFPGSLLAYVASLSVGDVFSDYGLYAYNSRLVLFCWWLVYFGFGIAQWFGVLWLVRRYKPNKSFNSDARDSRAG